MDNGPCAPVEFSRQSDDGRITLVIDKDAEPLRLLWAPLQCSDLEEAEKALCLREGVPTKSCADAIGTWKFGEPDPIDIPRLSKWASDQDVHSVIWTALKPRFNDEERSPSSDELIAYLNKLAGTVRDRAREYFEKAPLQIDTNYRRAIQTGLGWRPE